MQILLAVLLSVFSPEPFHNPPPLDHFGIINTEWDTHDEGWDKVFALEVQHPGTYAQQTSEDSDVYRGMGSGDVEQWRTLVASQFPAGQVDNALCVINSESGGSPSAKNPRSNARGLFQIMTSVWADEFGWTYEDFYVPELNVYAAARIWERSGWKPWSSRTRRICGL